MPALIEICAAWLLVKQWAADTMSFVDLEKELSSLSTYDYSEWREIFKKVEIASDPTEEHLVSAVDIVIEEARAHGLSLSNDNSHNTAMTSASSSLVVSGSRLPSKEPRWSHKHHKLTMQRYLDLNEEDNEEDKSELDDEIQLDCPHTTVTTLESSSLVRSGSQRPSKEHRQLHEHSKLAMYRYLNLNSSDDEEDETESKLDNEIQLDHPHLKQIQCLGL